MESNVSTHLHVYRRFIGWFGATSCVSSTLLLLHEHEVSYTLQMCFLKLASIGSSIWSPPNSSSLSGIRRQDARQSALLLIGRTDTSPFSKHTSPLWKSNARRPRRRSQKIFGCTPSNGLLACGLGVCGQVLYFSALKLATYNTSSGSITLLTPTCVLVFKHQRW